MAQLPINSTLVLDEREFEERFVRASGPGGQNVNKVATAVELRFDIAASSLPPDVKTRLKTIAGSRLTSEGILLIDSREHRTQAQNRDAARVRLIGLIQQATKRPRKRTPTRPSAASRERRLESKKQRAQTKTRRSRERGDE